MNPILGVGFRALSWMLCSSPVLDFPVSSSQPDPWSNSTSMTCTLYQLILQTQSGHYQPWISTLAQSWLIPPSPAQVHSCFTPALLCPSITLVNDPRSSSGPTLDHPTIFLTFLQPYSSCLAPTHFLQTQTQLTHLVSAKSTLDPYLFLFWFSSPVPASNPLTLSPSLLPFPDPQFIFLPQS